jgi:acyl carrier protein
MEKKEIMEKLQGIFRTVFKNDALELTENLSADDIDNWDSLTHMLLVSEMEDTFSVKFKLKDLNRMKDVDDMIAVLVEKVSSTSVNEKEI